MMRRIFISLSAPMLSFFALSLHCELRAFHLNDANPKVTEPAKPISDKFLRANVILSSQKMGIVGENFLGFSYEKSILSTPHFQADNKALIRFFSNLGTGVLRIGGNTVNQTEWHPEGEGYIPFKTSPSDIERLAGFLRAVNWKVIYGLNAATSLEYETANEADFVLQILGDRLESFEVGNEPDLYHKNKLRPENYTYDHFLFDWDYFTSAIKYVSLNPVFSGPSSAHYYAKYTIPFASDRGNKINQLTHHYYRANGKSPDATMDLLLAPDRKLILSLIEMNKVTKLNNIPNGYRMVETNSFYNGGADGVSNAFGSALWLIDYCFTLAKYGAVGANFHGGGKIGGYTPISSHRNGQIVGAEAIYYGMLLFSKMLPGEILNSKIKLKHDNKENFLKTHSVIKSDGEIATVLINTSRIHSIKTKVIYHKSISSATAMLLTAPHLESTKGFQFAGSSIEINGQWSPVNISFIFNSKYALEVSVPSGSAILIQAN
ncbi:hypothetical protein [Silvanigrella aquatica]|uniref:Beta-glucuronidase C-terminal domain-containing protein n=1 Tax=Silvanigrella aquatica TaxID=1915309 RepID=A0A1L4D1U6_9BACT|nr:hypothetical protein [Silvanigrella aquatica]APJ04160.1 hypothetical protein AXG55_09695 [Silvanigrella aquatica]